MSENWTESKLISIGKYRLLHIVCEVDAFGSNMPEEIQKKKNEH